MGENNRTWLTSAQTITGADGTVRVLLPCTHWYAWLSPAEVRACQTVERECGLCRTVYDIDPMTNETLALTGSYGPFPESGLTVLTGLAGQKPGTVRDREGPSGRPRGLRKAP